MIPARWLVLLAACGGNTPSTPSDGAIDDSSPPPVDGTPGTCTRCPNPGTVENRGPAPAGLVEASGIVASRTQPGVLYAHNDSGDTARVFAFDDTGAAIATLTITGATHVDWEDIAIGPCPAGTCIYVGDIGDNNTNRQTKTVYRFPEPTLALGQPPITMSIAAEALPFQYPAALHNAETLLVHPAGDIYVVTKENLGTPSVVFKFPQPLTPGTTATLVQLATLPFPSGNEPDVSGGSIDPCGGSVLLRLGSAALYQLDVAAGQPFDTAFAATPKTLPIAAEANGEAITWDAVGAGYFTISEGAGAQLHRIACP